MEVVNFIIYKIYNMWYTLYAAVLILLNLCVRKSCDQSNGHESPAKTIKKIRRGECVELSTTNKIENQMLVYYFSIQN